MSADRLIIHSDLNSFYASVECFENPALRDKPVAVTGDPDMRHGIILTKNQVAKKYNLVTGEAIWQAKQKCPDLICVPADYKKYLKYSELAKKIYADYTDQIESFGIDENWLDITGSTSLFGTGEKIANEIRERIKYEMGITASIGVSYNKIFAKLGSDYKKPEATTVIDKNNYKNIAWALPVNDLLYVGRSTYIKLKSMGINTIGDLAVADIKRLQRQLGVVGIVLHRFANGEDSSPVAKVGEESFIKSVGNSVTAPRDMKDIKDVKNILYMLSESVAARLREHGLKCTRVQIHIRDTGMVSCERQAKLLSPTYITQEIAEKALDIFATKYTFRNPLRSIGVRGINLVSEDSYVQTNLFENTEKREKLESLEKEIDKLRFRYGYNCIQRGTLLEDRGLTKYDIKADNTIHPVGYFNDGSMIH